MLCDGPSSLTLAEDRDFITLNRKQLARVPARRNCRLILCGVHWHPIVKSASSLSRCRRSSRFARSLLGQHVSRRTQLPPRGRAAPSSVAIAVQRNMQLRAANSHSAVVQQAVLERSAAATAPADQQTEAPCNCCQQRRSCRPVDSAAESSAPRCSSDGCYRSRRLRMGQTLQLVCLKTGL